MERLQSTSRAGAPKHSLLAITIGAETDLAANQRPTTKNRFPITYPDTHNKKFEFPWHTTQHVDCHCWYLLPSRSETGFHAQVPGYLLCRCCLPTCYPALGCPNIES